ncbi:MAG: hypothetical protein ABL921_30340 [Pirellula sp.]
MTNDFEADRETLRRLAILYRSFPMDLIDRVAPERCPLIISQFAIWLLDSSLKTLRFDWQYELHAKLRELHEQRIRGEPIDQMLWNSLQADTLAGSKLWPPQWVSVSSDPWGSPLARTAVAIGAALIRHDRETGKEIRVGEHSQAQANALLGFLQITESK